MCVPSSTNFNRTTLLQLHAKSILAKRLYPAVLILAQSIPKSTSIHVPLLFEVIHHPVFTTSSCPTHTSPRSVSTSRDVSRRRRLSQVSRGRKSGSLLLYCGQGMASLSTRKSLTRPTTLRPAGCTRSHADPSRAM